MKVYLKLLLITASVQVLGFLLTYAVDGVLRQSGGSTIAPVFVGLACIAVSMILGLILALRWCGSKRAAAVTLLLLPTNYTFLFLGILLVRFVGGLLDILSDIPPNFG